MGKTIDEVFAFVSSDKQPEGWSEGILSFQAFDGIHMPMIGADMQRVRSLIPIADELARKAKITYRIYHFTNKRDITDEVKP